jgi:hypothetical protein
METPYVRQKLWKRSLKGHHYKDLTRFIHDEKRENLDIVEISGHLDTNATLKNHIDTKLKENLTTIVATLRRK